MEGTKYLTESGRDEAEARQRIRAKYGDNVRIVFTKKAVIDYFLGIFPRKGVELMFYVPQAELSRKTIDFDEERKKIISLSAQNKQDPMMDKVIKEIQELKESVGKALEKSPDAVDHPAIEAMEKLLADNDFTPWFIRRIVERLRKELTVIDLENSELLHETVLQWIGETIRVQALPNASGTQSLILVGPTGVGKTTTIAKLSALYGVVAKKPKNVRMFSIDNYRLAAKEQIEKYSEIMNISMACVYTVDELKKQLALCKDVDLVLIDTIGLSPRDYTHIAEMNGLLSAVNDHRSVHLAVSAVTKSSDLAEIMAQYEPFRYEAVVVTKLDETGTVGSIISILHEKQKALSYLTHGQKVPQDIKKASVMDLLRLLRGFHCGMARLEQRFS